MDTILVLHIGAGKHSIQQTRNYKKILRSAICASDLIQASRVVERSALTNTGFGSSVDRTCTATSDACLIEVSDGRIVNSLALLNIHDDAFPTTCVDKIARQLKQEYAAGSVDRCFGLSKPTILDYKTYKEYLDLSKRKKLKFYKRRKGNPEKSLPTTEQTFVLPGIEDTVGFIEIANSPKRTTRIASSSGGNFYRLPGRVSCAGTLGSGIGYSRYKDVEVSCMCSGNGDDIIAMNLAGYLSENMAGTLGDSNEWPELGPLLESHILRKSQLVVKTAVNASVEEITYIGVVMVVRSPDATRLVFCHSTESLYFAFRLRGKSELVLSRKDRPVGEFLSGEYKLD
ncbi:N-terminal nucleophile aminohydrolase [Metschnikowia bicuspidata var. bicuspidata NRRL YB-4993]|uniref:N-terminal nucleophile aminohydrolase n=1 Tax=Metschnikowia bicuspidata var. bicuspidata NRRL YB-4993 TaxID=869754 RepID=A0A1A0H550_9ASCO|nr:N-terminal nucleophile aminohydrolase [Metschnikowia bicuspidata var. bicuspidata NRRL YB-4993]OBA19204.1 N-terminal nucleophile aminohydrolase [Metschnikowia bicuspidata var. bicuspidata NRRL YB-4993]